MNARIKMLKHFLVITIVLFPLSYASMPQMESSQQHSTIDEALEKAQEELKDFKLDTEYLCKLHEHYELNLTDATTGDFAQYYLVGTCDLHEVYVMAQLLQIDSTLLVSTSTSPNYLDKNREFFERFLSIFYSI